eukprot:scaffold368679_cov43-Prasinocladus_malaysianus.AAC.1
MGESDGLGLVSAIVGSDMTGDRFPNRSSIRRYTNTFSLAVSPAVVTSAAGGNRSPLSQGSRYAKRCCQVLDCGFDLSKEKGYYQRRRI